VSDQEHPVPPPRELTREALDVFGDLAPRLPRIGSHVRDGERASGLVGSGLPRRREVTYRSSLTKGRST
jgi:hypothetical protein